LTKVHHPQAQQTWGVKKQGLQFDFYLRLVARIGSRTPTEDCLNLLPKFKRGTIHPTFFMAVGFDV